ncbi:MAG: 16S rRNA (cytosine(1402)-N(4))-methyltransferase RsmH [Rhodospirillales bacterium]|nr:MAG: 16S rRNA (cytosine(1402)-N(4))-methyltransferase RsmH [Rhodospirillales bacterium]
MTPSRTPTLTHTPVMLAEVLAALAPRPGGDYVDATFGAGGYTRAILAAAPCRVFAIDRDPEALARGRDLARDWDNRLQLLAGRFGDMERLLAAVGQQRVDGVAFDLGMASTQVDAAARGFSFRTSGPLDMRMDPTAGETAADVVNTASEAELARIIRDLGEERAARRIAKAVVAARGNRPFRRTDELAALVRSIVPATAGGVDPATRTFQALRIHVNDELGELDHGLGAAERLLVPGGRLVVVAYHSLEDRRVKRFLRDRSGTAPRPSRHQPGSASAGGPSPSFRLLGRGTVKPSTAEMATNPRSRSARLRAAERTDAPPHNPGEAPLKKRAAA